MQGKWLAGQADDLDRADDPARVLPVNSLKSRRVGFLQFRQQFRQRPVFQLRPQRRVRRRRIAQALAKGLEIKSRATAKNRNAPAGLDFRHGAAGQLNEAGRVKPFFQSGYVN